MFWRVLSMNKIHHGPWLILPILLSAIFAVLFYPVVQERYESLYSILFTFVGVCMIWITYFIRANIFTHLFADKIKITGKLNRSHSISKPMTRTAAR